MNRTFWDFDLSASAVSLALITVAAALVLLVFNRRRDRFAGRLEFIRLAAMVMLALTFFRPEHVRETRRAETPRVAVLIDGSGSMETQDVERDGGGVERRAEWIERQIERRFWSPLEPSVDVVLDRFSVHDEAEEAPAPAEDAPEDDFLLADGEGPGTDIAGGLDRAREQGGRELRAVLLLSDGDWNEGEPPAAAAARLRREGVPVFAVTVGSDRYLPDLEITSVQAPAYGLVDEHISIPFSVRNWLDRSVTTTATLTDRTGAVRARADIRIPAQGAAQDTIVFVPDQEGIEDLVLSIPVQPEEIREDNNRRGFRMEIRQQTISVLVVDTYPRWEYRFLRNALVRDPGVSVRTLLLHPDLGAGGGPHYIPEFPSRPEDLSPFDVIFLGDVGVGPRQLSPENLQAIRDLVEQQGSGLVFLPGMYGFQRTLQGTPLEALLPVEYDWRSPEGGHTAFEARFELTERGREHLLTLLAPTPAANAMVWRNLPGFMWHGPGIRARAGSEVLAVHSSVRGPYGRIPLLATREAGYGKVLYMGIDSAWRWRRGVEDLHHYRFWSQVARWMSHKRHLARAEGIRFFLAPENPERGAEVFLHATVFDPQGRPLPGATVEARVEHPRGATDQFTLRQEGDGEWGVYTGRFRVRGSGRHQVVVRVEETGLEAESTFLVPARLREEIGRPARPGVMREIAAVSGGRAGDEDDLDLLVSQIRALPEPRPLEERLRVWAHPGWGGAVILLLSAYWVGRKLKGRV